MIGSGVLNGHGLVVEFGRESNSSPGKSIPMSQNTPQKWFNLEEAFYEKVDQQLLRRLRGEMKIAETAESIMQVAGIADSDLAEAIAGLNVTVDTLSAFRLAPLVAVAWADDRVEESEEYTITLAAEKSGITTDEPAMELLKAWTAKRPSEELLNVWCEYAKALAASLPEVHRETLRKEILSQVQAVAKAAGGILGFGSVSPTEKAIIERIEKALA